MPKTPIPTMLFEWEGYTVERASIGSRGLDGLCDYADESIIVGTHLRGREELETLLHEGLHRLLPDATEAQVAEAGHKLMQLAWAYGYRRRAPPRDPPPSTK